MPRIVQEALTFDDVLLIPAYSEVLPKNVSLKTRLTREISLNIPMVSAAMDTVTEHRLAIGMAQEGGIGILHKNMEIEEQAQNVRLVKKYESGVVKDPITVGPNTSVAELIRITEAHNISGVPVVEDETLVGIVTSRDTRFVTEYNQPVSAVMTAQDNLVTVKEDASAEEVQQLLHRHRIEKVLVGKDAGELPGLNIVKDMEQAKRFTNAYKNYQGRSRVGAAVATAANSDARVRAWVEAGVDVIVVATAHGHSRAVIERVAWVKKHFPHIQVIGGNIATGDAAIALADAGADAVKVGIGPGSICTTRIVTGIGVPQISAIADVAKALAGRDIPLIADGGIRFSGDVPKAIAAGANCIMVGSLMAGTEEAPGEVELYQGRYYKAYRGMGSLGAMSGLTGSSDRYF